MNKDELRAEKEIKHELCSCRTPDGVCCDDCNRRVNEIQIEIDRAVVRFLEIYPVAKKKDTLEYSACRIALSNWIFTREMNIRVKNWGLYAQGA